MLFLNYFEKIEDKGSQYCFASDSIFSRLDFGYIVETDKLVHIIPNDLIKA